MSSPAPILRPRVLLLLACASLLATTGCRDLSGRPKAHSEITRPDQVSDFATLYADNCSACHGSNGKNAAAIPLNNPAYLAIAGVPNVQRITAAGVSGTAMPAFAKSSGGMLTDQQIAILSRQMVQRWGRPDALAGQTAPPFASSGAGNPAQGEKAFATFCARCHGADGTGASVNGVSTGSLVDPSYLALITDQGLRSMILAGQTEQGAHDWRSYVSGHPMTDQEITDTVAWLVSHRIATPGQPYAQR